jgi:hypothetical protein
VVFKGKEVHKGFRENEGYKALKETLDLEENVDYKVYKENEESKERPDFKEPKVYPVKIQTL